MSPLDNPVYSSLKAAHAAFAREADGLLRYASDVAPFLAIPEAGPVSAAALDALVDDRAYMIGPRPIVPAGWLVEDLGRIHQMVCAEPLPVPPGPPSDVLGEADRPVVLALAALVYPHYFRPRTMELGRYLGVRGEAGLDAMIGERMAAPGFREISAVCTHPTWVGRGLARRLLAIASNEIFARGETPFLHVSPNNQRAVRLYEQNGYRHRIDVPFWSVQRRP